MSIFNNIGKKLSSSGQNAIQRTKDIAEANRLGSTVGELEKLVNETYAQIGRRYVELHPSDYESDFVNAIGVIKSSEAKISELKDRMSMLRGFVKCPQCGAAVSADANFCEECGAQMPPKAAPQPAGELRCEGCGKMIPSDSKFCGGCGRPVAPPAPPAPAVRICPQCGAACDEGSVFCTKCGTRLDGVTEEEGAQV